MRTPLRDRWVEALRSGAYRQAHAMLRADLEDGPRFCCLGVALAIDGFDWAEHEANQDGIKLSSYRLLEPYGISCKQEMALMKMNDDEELPFAEIADRLEAMP